MGVVNRPERLQIMLNPAEVKMIVSLRWRPPSRIGFEREMICSLIRKQMSKRDDGYGSVRSRAATAVDECREASDCGGESGAWSQCCRGCSAT